MSSSSKSEGSDDSKDDGALRILTPEEALKETGRRNDSTFVPFAVDLEGGNITTTDTMSGKAMATIDGHSPSNKMGKYNNIRVNVWEGNVDKAR